MSPGVLRRDGFTVFVFVPPREHGPAHVHVRKAGGEVVILLTDGSVHSASGMPDRDIAAARRMVLDDRDYLIRYWEHYHNDAT
jgi:Domain of unknown function (DUF4160)